MVISGNWSLMTTMGVLLKHFRATTTLSSQSKSAGLPIKMQLDPAPPHGPSIDIVLTAALMEHCCVYDLITNMMIDP